MIEHLVHGQSNRRDLIISKDGNPRICLPFAHAPCKGCQFRQRLGNRQVHRIAQDGEKRCRRNHGQNGPEEKRTGFALGHAMRSEHSKIQETHSQHAPIYHERGKKKGEKQSTENRDLRRQANH
jgi:hypothetical protein